MIGLTEDKRTEFKIKLTDNIEKEVIAFFKYRWWKYIYRCR